MTEHTTVPWYVVPPAFRIGSRWQIRAQEPGQGNVESIIAEILWAGTERTKANAEFIIQACNAHEDLVKACEQALLRLGGYPGNLFTIRILEEALAKAKGVTP